LLLHDGGWDEALMVAAGLVIAYFVIVWTGRRGKDADDEEWDDEAPDVATDAAADQPPRQRS
jgi:hypothetical protein